MGRHPRGPGALEGASVMRRDVGEMGGIVISLGLKSFLHGSRLVPQTEVLASCL